MKHMRRRRTGDKPRGRRVADQAVLGRRGHSSRVGYAGEAFAPAANTYLIVDLSTLCWTTTNDGGRHPAWNRELLNLLPLVAAALYETGFAAEAGPLTTWSN